MLLLDDNAVKGKGHFALVLRILVDNSVHVHSPLPLNFEQSDLKTAHSIHTVLNATFAHLTLRFSL